MDENRNGCEVCFNDFDHQERRPRVFSCGHTFCSKCVRDNFKKNLLCPICRQVHHAETAADFPVNFKLESVLLGGTSIPSTDQPQAIIKKPKSMRAELCSYMENKATSNKRVRSQLHQYENLLNEKEMLHQQIIKKHFAIAQKNCDILLTIRKERARITEALKKEEKGIQKMKIVTDKLHAATTSQEVLLSREYVTFCYDFLERWNKETQENFPNTQLLTKSEVALHANIREATAEEPTEVRPTDHLSENMASLSLPSEASTLLNPKLSIQEKVARALENASFFKRNKMPAQGVNEKSVQTETNAAVIELSSKEIQTEETRQLIVFLQTGSAMKLMKEKRLFAVQKLKGRIRFAQISLLKKTRILLHYLKDQNIPSNAHLLQHNDVLKLVNVSSRLAFLELWSEENEEKLGKLFIRLSPNGKMAQQFALLCSGQNGPSYVESNIFQLCNKDKSTEYVTCGDYENLGGKGGRELVPYVWDEKVGEFHRPWKAGAIRGIMGYIPESQAAQFLIMTRDNIRGYCNSCFGMVEEGLHILQEAIDDHDDIGSVIFSDAGLVLDI